jgi:ABC-type molybdate transport system substrate-binding protein
MTWTTKPDVYLAGLAKVNGLIDQGLLSGPAVPYVTNDLTIMVPKDNPAHITDLADLRKPGVRLAMPNPEFEGIARQIEASLKKAGGQALAEAGVTWQSEAVFQEQAGHPIAHVDIPASQNTTAIYAGAMVKNASHSAAARLWLSFIHSPEALSIFEHYGFKPYAG